MRQTKISVPEKSKQLQFEYFNMLECIKIYCDEIVKKLKLNKKKYRE